MQIRVAVVGGSGYAGAELVGLLADHPGVVLASVQADSSAGAAWEEICPRGRHLFSGRIEPFDALALAGMDVVFLALPHGTSGRVAAELHGRVGTILDLSGDLRFDDAAAYSRWYGHEHPAPHLLGRAAYGLPELFPEALPGATLVACAGCYATAAQLALAPALASLPAGAGTVVVTGISGTTGAGRRADLALSFSEIGENLRAYRIGAHPHAPEIARGLRRLTGKDVAVTFVPHVAPIRRGILATAVVPGCGSLDRACVLAAYRAAYDETAFVRVVDPGRRLPEVRDVVGTNFCDVAPVVDGETGSLVVVAVLDNLLKGAAGQAVQAMNLVLGLPETAGLHSQVTQRQEASHA